MLRLYITFLDSESPEVREERLSSYRKEKLRTQTNEQIRKQSAAAELLLRYAMKDCGMLPSTPLCIERGAHGKPYLKEGECFFSLSHSSDAILCALGDLELGADVQIIRPFQESLLERCFSPAERAYVHAADEQDAAFTEIWAMKESYCKASGLGLALALNSFSVLDGSIFAHIWHDRIGPYQLAVYGEGIDPETIEINIVKTSAIQI